VEEMFDVVDEWDRVIGQAPRPEVHRRGLRHRAVHVLAFDDRGRLWLQLRSAAKDCFPLRWDSSAAGHLAVGESYAACAIREVREEMGLIVVPRYQFKIAACPATGWEHVAVHTCRARGAIRFDREEIARGGCFPLPAVAAWLDRAEEQFAPGFVKIYREFQRRGWRC
jgi:16S rRNA (adenine1518-N6/adenine1519-N6)-dimethyltransferase